MTLDVAEFEIASLDSLPAADVQQTLLRLVSQLQETYPEVDFKRGVFHDMLLMFHSVLETALRENLQLYLDARSLLQIEKNPALANDGVVDDVLSNWGIVRKEGTKAHGTILVVLSLFRGVTIPAGFLFEADGYTYAAMATYTVRTNAGQVATDTDRALQTLQDGTYAFTMDVEATVAGAGPQLNAGALLSPVSTIPSYVTSYATSSFTGGGNTETNDELLSAMQLGIATKALSNRVNMQAYLRSLPEFGSVTNQSIVGFGDAEMLRDRHNLFGLSSGGRVDWYFRGQQSLRRQSLTVTATLISVATDFSYSDWQFSLSRDVSPGFFEVSRIRRPGDPADTAGFTLLADNRVIDLSGDGFRPDIASLIEGAYTAYQASTIQFRDTLTTTTSLVVGQSAEYVCEVSGTPWVSELQEHMASRDVRNCAADILLRAPVPCFVQISMIVNKTAGDAMPDVASIKNDILRLINSTEFIGRLDGSRIIAIVQGYLSNNLSITDFSMLGRIRSPSGRMVYVRSSDSLLVPNYPDELITANTVQFFAEATDIAIDVRSVIHIAA